ncbi:MAG: cyclic nucleotide-binding domain-containing protein [bacterium]|nr:cyclic nucleotide-binding domain-containing protein [bacterium]
MSEKTDVFKKYVTQYKEGDILYKKGDEQEHFFIINKGRVQLKLDEQDLILISLTKGEFFGEESLNEGQDALYTVEAVENCDVIRIPYGSLTDMMKKNTAISVKILKKLSEKNLKILENLLSMELPAMIAKKDGTKVETAEDEKTSEKIESDVKAYLIIKRSNRIVQLTKTHTFLGRRDYTTGFVPDVDLTKEDEEKYISRKHSKISYIDGKFYVSEEPGAVNGTFLNGTRLSTGVKHELKNEDEVTLCHLDIVFKY